MSTKRVCAWCSTEMAMDAVGQSVPLLGVSFEFCSTKCQTACAKALLKAAKATK